MESTGFRNLYSFTPTAVLNLECETFLNLGCGTILKLDCGTVLNLECENILNFDCETFLNLESGAFLNLDCGTFLRNLGKNLGLRKNSLIEEKAIGVSLSLNMSYNKINATAETTNSFFTVDKINVIILIWSKSQPNKACRTDIKF